MPPMMPPNAGPPRPPMMTPTQNPTPPASNAMPPAAPPQFGKPAGTQADPALQTAVMERARGLSEADLAALGSISPEASAVIKRMLPELAPIIDAASEEGEQEPVAQAAPDIEAEDEDEMGPPRPMRPKTSLAKY